MPASTSLQRGGAPAVRPSVVAPRLPSARSPRYVPRRAEPRSGAGPNADGGDPPEAPRKQVVILYGPPHGPTQKGFKSQAALDKYLAKNDYLGLSLGAGQPVVDEWDQLEPDQWYTPVRKDSVRVADMDERLRHLGLRREDEFGEALRQVAAAQEAVPLEQAQLLPEARQLQHPDDKSCTLKELDAVVIVRKTDGPVVYIGSHKTYVNSTGDVQAAIKDTVVARDLIKAPFTALPAELKAASQYKVAFMAEKLGPQAATAVPQLCRERGVLLLSRSDGGIRLAL